MKKWQVTETITISDETFEILESGEEHTLPDIAKKLQSGQSLNQIESQMASACIFDWVRLKEAQIKGGMKRKFANDKERYRHHNNIRRNKVCDCSYCSDFRY